MQHMLSKATDQLSPATGGAAKHAHSAQEHQHEGHEAHEEVEKDRAHTHTKNVAAVNIAEDGEIDLEQVSCRIS
jgi:hypothetical protein